MKEILNTDEIRELLTVWFDNKDDDGWITRWTIKDNFSGKKRTDKEGRIFRYITKYWEHARTNSYGKFKLRPKEYKKYKRMDGKKMKREYSCKKCGVKGHNSRTCDIDEDLSRNGKPFQFEEIQEEVIEYINEESVNHPSHYNPGNIEVIDAIEDWGLDFNAGNVVKYVVRSCSSGDNKEDKRQDLEKAIWYINRILNKE